MTEQEQENPLQQKVDKLKTLSLLQNLHNLNPPNKEANPISDIMIVEALKVAPRLQSIYLEVRGLMIGDKNKLVQIADPIMNDKGAFKLINVIRHIAEEVEYGKFDEEEIPQRVVMYYELNYPYFTFWAKEYDLDPIDFNYISTTLLCFIDAAFHKAIGGHFARILTKTYAEKTLDKAIGSSGEKKDAKGGVLSRLARAII